jgi:hypothetical protein
MYKNLKDAYSARSKLVHGDSYEPPKIDIRSYMSESIIRYLDRLIIGNTHVDILDAIDFY